MTQLQNLPPSMDDLAQLVLKAIVALQEARLIEIGVRGNQISAGHIGGSPSDVFLHSILTHESGVLGQILYMDPAPALLAGNITATRKFLRQVGTGTLSAAPVWDTLTIADLPGLAGTVAIPFMIDGGGAVLTTGLKGVLEIPFSCTITGWTILGDQSGSIVVDVWKDSYANYPPVVGDSIAGTEKPTLASAVKNQDLTLTTWGTSIAAGDILAFNVDSVTTIQRALVSLRATRT